MSGRSAEDVSEAIEALDSTGPAAQSPVLRGAGGGTGIPQEVVGFAAYTSLHEAMLKRAILREVAKDAEPMRQLEQWTHESLRSIRATCAHYERELSDRLQTRCREMAEQFWNEVRAQAARLQEDTAPHR